MRRTGAFNLHTEPCEIFSLLGDWFLCACPDSYLRSAVWQQQFVSFWGVPRCKLGRRTGQSRPEVSTLNALTGTITANVAIVPAGENGDISVHVTQETALIIDVNGYFAPPASGGLSLYSFPPCRVYDSRPGAQPLTNTAEIKVTGGNCNAPANAQSYIFNATVVPAKSLLYLALWPHGEGNQPNASVLNAPDGVVTSNLAIVPTTDGSINTYASDSTHLILDILGYFAP